MFAFISKQYYLKEYEIDVRGYVINLDDLLKAKEVVVQLFNGQRWKINEKKAFRFSSFYEEGKPYTVIFVEGTTEELFS